MSKPFAALALASMIAAGAARADAPKADEMAPDLVARLVALFDRIVDAVVADKTDCAKMAKDIDAAIDADKALPAAAAKAKKDGKKLPKAAQDHMAEGAKRAVPAMQSCGDKPAVQKAFKRLEPEA
jgi:hypothetical protein